jgi:prepilin-type N-terminal cleavage/methylation domain-containing protein
MKRSAFTLVELIFTIVIIGVLAAVAVPKFKSLEDNAKIGNVAKFYGDISSAVKPAYMNEVTLNDTNATDLNLTQLFDFTGKGWTVTNSNDTATYSVLTSDGNLTLLAVYDNDGSIDINITAVGTTTKEKITSKTGLTLVNDINQTRINLAE